MNADVASVNAPADAAAMPAFGIRAVPGRRVASEMSHADA